MDIKKFSADLVFTADGSLMPDVVITTDENGKVLTTGSVADHDPITVDKRQGILCPGFINTHCHLELSHMKGRVQTGTGLLPFLKNVVSFRDINQEVISWRMLKKMTRSM